MTRFLGEVFPQPKPFANFPFAPSAMPGARTAKHVALVIGDFVANTFLFSARQKGLAKQTFDASDDPTIKNLLGKYIDQSILSEHCEPVSESYQSVHPP